MSLCHTRLDIFIHSVSTYMYSTCVCNYEYTHIYIYSAAYSLQYSGHACQCCFRVTKITTAIIIYSIYYDYFTLVIVYGQFQSTNCCFYGPQGHFYDCFPYIYIYTCTCICLWPHMRLCIVYVVKEVMSFPGLGQLMGEACKRTCTQALQTSRKKAVQLTQKLELIANYMYI